MGPRRGQHGVNAVASSISEVVAEQCYAEHVIPHHIVTRATIGTDRQAAVDDDRAVEVAAGNVDARAAQSVRSPLVRCEQVDVLGWIALAQSEDSLRDLEKSEVRVLLVDETVDSRSFDPQRSRQPVGDTRSGHRIAGSGTANRDGEPGHP